MINSVVMCVLFRVFVLSVRSFEDRNDPHKETIPYCSSELVVFASIAPAELKKLLHSNEALNANYYANKDNAKFDTTLE